MARLLGRFIDSATATPKWIGCSKARVASWAFLVLPYKRLGKTPEQHVLVEKMWGGRDASEGMFLLEEEHIVLSYCYFCKGERGILQNDGVDKTYASRGTPNA